MLYFLIFLIGLCLGSFLNVVIYRLENKEQILMGRSYCPKCKAVLKWFDFLGCVYDENDIDDSALKAKATGSKRMISFDNTSPFYDAKSLGTGEKVFEFDPNGAWYKKLRRE